MTPTRETGCGGFLRGDSKIRRGILPALPVIDVKALARQRITACPVAQRRAGQRGLEKSLQPEWVRLVEENSSVRVR